MIVIEQSAWDELINSVKSLTEAVHAMIKDRREPEILTQKEAAAYLGYSYGYLNQLKDDRKIPFSQHSRRISYRREDLDAFLKEHRIEKRR